MRGSLTDAPNPPLPPARLAAALELLERVAARATERATRARALEAAVVDALAELDRVLGRG